jgi:hypothetical protein
MMSCSMSGGVNMPEDLPEELNRKDITQDVMLLDADVE